MQDDLRSRTFVVNQRHPDAGDSNPGTEDRPFRTIQRAADVARYRGGEWPGDRIVVKAGVYREMVILRYGGDEQSSIDLSAAPGEEVYVKGSDVVTRWHHDEGAVWYAPDWDYPSQQVFCDDRILRQVASFHGEHIPPFVSFDDSTSEPCAGRTAFANPHYLRGIDGGRRDMLPGSFHHDPAARRLYVWLEDGSDPNGRLMEVSVRPHIFKGVGASACGIRIAGFKLRHTSAHVHGFWPQGGMNGAIETGPRRWIVENCDVRWTGFVGLLVSGRDHLVRNNVFNCNGNSGINIGSPHGPGPIPAGMTLPPVENVVVEGNVTSENNYRGFSPSWWCGGMKIIPYCKRVRVVAHVAERNRGPGIWFDSDCEDGQVGHCLVRDNDGHGIYSEICERTSIWNNVVLRNSNGINIEGSRLCRVYHNLCVGNDYGLVMIRDGLPKWQVRDNVVRNNIIADSLGYDMVAVAPSARFPRNSIDFNLYHRRSGQPRFEIQNEAVLSDLAAWRDRTGWDRHSLVADPAWTAPELDDYHLRAGSPAIDAGVPLESVPVDFDGHSRPNGAGMDLGPFECQE